MFKKVRNRILIINMAMLSAVVITAMGLIFASAYSRVLSDNKAKLAYSAMPSFFGASRIYGADFQQTEIEHGIVAVGDDIFLVDGIAQRISPYAGLSFSIIVDGYSAVTEINSVIDWPESAYFAAVSDVIEKSRPEGVLSIDGRRWQYAVHPLAVGFYGQSSSQSGESYNNIRFLDVTDSHKMLASLSITLCVSTAAILLVFFFISLFFANRAVKPMQEAFEKQGRFLADASHELKTPLSVINASCSVLYANSSETVESQQRWVDSIITNSDRMAGLIKGLLSLAQLDSQGQALKLGAFSMSDAVKSAASEIEPLARAKSLAVAMQVEENISVVSDKEHVMQVLFILLDNALKYSSEGGSVLVKLKREHRRVVCTIRNSGEGISPELLPYVFDRFTRGDASRSSENIGYGLGLAIAKDISAKLGAELAAHSELGAYAEFSFALKE
ncbi:MAG: HAMP domain-containing histidine kinase [Eubacteriaceae bacterium]|nr:HAMP domain-containing histidine kinase [Eubacteriaceae bacterium]